MKIDMSVRGVGRSAATLLRFCAFFLLCLSYAQSNKVWAILADCLIYVVILCSPAEEDFITYAFLLPLTGLMPTSIFRLYFCHIISIAKIFLKHRSVTVLGFLGICYMSFQFLLFDFLLGQTRSILTLLMFMIYIFILVDVKLIEKVDYKRLANMTNLSCMLILFFILISSSSLDAYIHSSNIQFKLGEEVRELGGAMGVSLYTTVGVAIAFVLMLTSKGVGRLLSVASLFYYVLFALFALSRTFFLAFAVAVMLSVWFQLPKINKIKPKTFIWLSVVVIVALLAAILGGVLYAADIGAMVEKLFTLMKGINLQSSRFKIWHSIAVFWSDHPQHLLFGLGTNSYMRIPLTEQYAFYGYGAHNLLLDTILSFGIVGFVLLLFLMKKEISTLKKNASIQNKTVFVEKGIFCFPIVLYWTSQMAQGSFRDLQSYVYPVLIFAVVYGMMRIKNKNG